MLRQAANTGRTGTTTVAHASIDGAAIPFMALQPSQDHGNRSTGENKRRIENYNCRHRHQLHCIYVSPLTQSIANRVYTQEVRTELATKEEWRPILFGPDLIQKTLEDRDEEQDL